MKAFLHHDASSCLAMSCSFQRYCLVNGVIFDDSQPTPLFRVLGSWLADLFRELHIELNKLLSFGVGFLFVVRTWRPSREGETKVVKRRRQLLTRRLLPKFQRRTVLDTIINVYWIKSFRETTPEYLIFNFRAMIRIKMSETRNATHSNSDMNSLCGKLIKAKKSRNRFLITWILNNWSLSWNACT